MYDGSQMARVWIPTDGKGNIQWNELGKFQDALTQLEENPKYTNGDKATK